MAIIYNHEPATTWDGQVKVPKPCPVCGMQMFSWSGQKYGQNHDECFSATCANPVPIGMIRGDVRDFTKRESIQGYPYVTYKAAKTNGFYSAELRQAAKKQLTAWGFTKITFVEPTGEEKTERDTVIMGVHVSPKVNVLYRTAPKTQRVLTFENKYGVVSLVNGFHESHEKSYHAWYTIYRNIQEFNKTVGNNTAFGEKGIITIPDHDTLKKQAEEAVISSQKSAFLSEIRQHLSKINSLKNEILSYQKYIAEKKEDYQEKFGEPAPKQPGED